MKEFHELFLKGIEKDFSSQITNSTLAYEALRFELVAYEDDLKEVAKEIGRLAKLYEEPMVIGALLKKYIHLKTVLVYFWIFDRYLTQGKSWMSALDATRKEFIDELAYNISCFSTTTAITTRRAKDESISECIVRSPFFVINNYVMIEELEQCQKKA